MTTNYKKQANDFLTKTGVTFNAEFLKNDFHFPGDKDKRDIYKITLTRGTRSYSFDFGQSIVNSGFRLYLAGHRNSINIEVPEDKRNYYLDKKNSYGLGLLCAKFGYCARSDKFSYPVIPNSYDVLTCLTKYDPCTFEDFCSAFGYDTDSRTAEKTYNAVKDEYLNLCALFTSDELEEMQEIQ
jgi:hypothetical protein